MSISKTPQVRRGYTVCPELLVLHLPGKTLVCAEVQWAEPHPSGPPQDPI